MILKQSEMCSKQFRKVRAKRVAAQCSFCLVLSFLFRTGLELPHTITLDMHTREEYLNASKVNGKIRAREKVVLTDGSRKRYRNDTSNATLSLIDESFWIKRLDVSRPVQCGANKCFFETTDDPDVGY
jgi:hypothetical protein